MADREIFSDFCWEFGTPFILSLDCLFRVDVEVVDDISDEERIGSEEMICWDIFLR
jgi:hypothetical protein